MHRQGADITARKLQRLNSEPVGGDHLPSGRKFDRRRVDMHIQPAVTQMTRKDLVYQLAHQASAIAVGEADMCVLQLLLLGVERWDQDAMVANCRSRAMKNRRPLCADDGSP